MYLYKYRMPYRFCSAHAEKSWWIISNVDCLLDFSDWFWINGLFFSSKLIEKWFQFLSCQKRARRWVTLIAICCKCLLHEGAVSCVALQWVAWSYRMRLIGYTFYVYYIAYASCVYIYIYRVISNHNYRSVDITSRRLLLMLNSVLWCTFFIVVWMYGFASFSYVWCWVIRTDRG